MKRLLFSLAVCMLAGMLATSCTSIPADSQDTAGTDDNKNTSSAADGGRVSEEERTTTTKHSSEQTGFTRQVPASYLRAAQHQGSVERIDYESHDYAGNGAAITKTAYVYVPYGYDADDDQTKYAIVYLMHGWTGHAGEFFEYGNVRTIIDNMIQQGDIPPTIFVSPTFYAPNGSTGFGSSVAALRAFHEDFEHDLMPAVEGRYRTFAASTSDEDLRASRMHRIFGGFSLGSVTTWQIFCWDYDYVAGFLPMSGSSWYFGGFGDFQTRRNVDYIQQLVDENDLDARGYFIYQAVGTQDSMKGQTVMQAQEMLARPDVFTPDHYAFYQKEGGQHDYDAVREFIYNGLPVIFRHLSADSNETADESPVFQPFAGDTPIAEVAADPAFGEWGRLIFPVQAGYWSGNTLADLQMAWYNFIDPNKTVEICNYLKAQALAGEPVFIDIYTEAEKTADPAKDDVGLFFFRGDPGARTAIVNAGGGFSYVGAMHDSFPHALELSKRGYNAFALIYRPGSQTACEDLARAIAYLHRHAAELDISMDGYSLWGGSAGGRMAAWLGAYGTEAFGEAAYPRSAACIVNYTGLSEVTGAEPPTYDAVGTADGIANWRTMQSRIQRIRANGTDAQIEIFDGLPHGFGLGTGTAAEGWIDRAVAFWERQL